MNFIWHEVRRSHQGLRIVVLRVADDLFGRAVFDHLPFLQHQDVIRNLRHQRQIVRHVNRCGTM